MRPHLFIAGVPATGKTKLGRWLAANEGYRHIDAENDDGIDFAIAGIRDEWETAIATGRAAVFLAALNGLGSQVVITWGFPVAFLYVVKALQAVGIQTWWVHGSRPHARAAYVGRYLAGDGPHPKYFDPQMDAIEKEWLLIASVFEARVVSGLNADGSQRTPADM